MPAQSTADRPQLKKLMAVLTHGDVVIIPAVDRLSRDTTDLLVIAREMQRRRGWHSITRRAVPLIRPRTLPRLFLQSLALPRSWNIAASRSARHEAARARRRRASKFGRKPKLTPHQQREAIRRRDVDGETLRSIGRSYNVSAQTISRLNTS
jgi:DNA invertase Pin-like site-specific DNA recombinase